jgi:hypothetical protein
MIITDTILCVGVENVKPCLLATAVKNLWFVLYNETLTKKCYVCSPLSSAKSLRVASRAAAVVMVGIGCDSGGMHR